MSEPHNPYLHHPDVLPCYRCGGQIEILVPPPENVSYYGWWCNKCGIKASRYDFDTLEKTIEDANRRTPSPVGTATMREATDALDEYEKAIRSEQITKEFRESRVNKEDLAAVDAARSRILALLPRSAPTLKGAPADDKRK